MPDPLCRSIPWDSEFFGHRIFQVNGFRIGHGDREHLVRECETHAVECLYFLADPDDPESVRQAEDLGFRLVDVRVTLTSPGGGPPVGDKSISVRPARTEDLPHLERIAAEVHSDSRFFADPRLSARAPNLYRAWISKSVNGDADLVLVAVIDHRPVGYVTGHLEDAGDGRIGLLGVAPSARGKGAGEALVRRALTWFHRHGARRVDVVTQGRNIGAQVLYQRCGFVTSNIRLWFHKWFSPADDGYS